MNRLEGKIALILGAARGIGPITGRCFPLDEIAAAQVHVEADRHVGKVVIQIQGHRPYDAGLRCRGGESFGRRAIGLLRA